ncbi:MAG: Uncharacterised protein [Owenweeksia sp. TMED14]|nr:MAG: Uncharacterised protein [Owenweeksia sp. TMED14]|tara:strand:- start:582 stop:875 length:294 start_codon:yes stop_codon:yes gene_type:complete
MSIPKLKSLSEVLNTFTKPFKNKKEYKIALVENAWKEILGEQAHQKVRKFSIKDQTLYVTCESNSLRHELSMQKRRLLDALNEKLQDEPQIESLVLN